MESIIEKYTNDCCERFWKYMHNANGWLTIGSLHYLAKKR